MVLLISDKQYAASKTHPTGVERSTEVYRGKDSTYVPRKKETDNLVGICVVSRYHLFTNLDDPVSLTRTTSWHKREFQHDVFHIVCKPRFPYGATTDDTSQQ